MRFINRNAYIMCAIKNTNFCKSAYSAFNLIMRNLVRVVVLDSVVDFLLFLGKLVIVVITGSVSYLAFAGHLPDIKVGHCLFYIFVKKNALFRIRFPCSIIFGFLFFLL